MSDAWKYFWLMEWVGPFSLAVFLAIPIAVFLGVCPRNQYRSYFLRWYSYLPVVFSSILVIFLLAIFIELLALMLPLIVFLISLRPFVLENQRRRMALGANADIIGVVRDAKATVSGAIPFELAIVKKENSVFYSVKLRDSTQTIHTKYMDAHYVTPDDRTVNVPHDHPWSYWLRPLAKTGFWLLIIISALFALLLTELLAVVLLGPVLLLFPGLAMLAYLRSDQEWWRVLTGSVPMERALEALQMNIGDTRPYYVSMRRTKGKNYVFSIRAIDTQGKARSFSIDARTGVMACLD